MKLIHETIDKIKPRSSQAMQEAKDRIMRLTMPHWALGRICDLAVDLSGMTGSIRPPIKRKTIVVMAGDHGITAEGVSLYPKEVTAQMVHNFAQGGAGINVLSRLTGTSVAVADLGVDGDLSALGSKILQKKIARGTRSMLAGPAMTYAEAIRSVEAGIEIACELAESTDVFGTGDMGIGNTTPSTAIASVITGVLPELIAGRGTGIDLEALKKKINVIEKSLKANKPDRKDALDILSKVGGFEIGGIAGLIIGAASLSKPVLIDGFISTSAALIANELAPECAQYMIAAHKGAEAGHQIMLEYLGLKPLLELELRLGEGTGAALAMNLLDAAFSILTNMATFEEASVSKAEK